ncbi:DoxX family protein [Chitinivorax sp. PXF-14]|uniref:DoxX family protein n=1 Tax=Chitinivorax sp. PXF-14 TaxID=3230488 RepID=UPI00346634C2
MNATVQALIHLANRAIAALDCVLAPLVDLAVRLYLASVFFQSGLTKIADWSSTVALFQDEYKVPLLPPELAAAMGTGGELGLPVLLVLGLGGRFAASGLFVLNAVAVYSYYDSLVEATRLHHYLWGALLAMLLVHGPGAIAVDRWIKRRWGSI